MRYTDRTIEWHPFLLVPIEPLVPMDYRNCPVPIVPLVPKDTLLTPLTPMESICEYWTTTKMAWLNWPGTLNLLGATAYAAFRFQTITDPTQCWGRRLYYIQGGFLGETSILTLFAFVRQGQSNRLNGQKITLRVITLLSTFLRSYCKNRTWKCVVSRWHGART